MDAWQFILGRRKSRKCPNHNNLIGEKKGDVTSSANERLESGNCD